MWHDTMLEEIWKFREEYARQFGYDARAILQDLQATEQQHRHKVISFQTESTGTSHETETDIQPTKATP